MATLYVPAPRVPDNNVTRHCGSCEAVFVLISLRSPLASLGSHHQTCSITVVLLFFLVFQKFYGSFSCRYQANLTLKCLTGASCSSMELTRTTRISSYRYFCYNSEVAMVSNEPYVQILGAENFNLIAKPHQNG